MDSLTQAALGAAIGQALLGSRLGRKAAILGAAVATIPDLDVILYAFFSPLEMLRIHRGFSHSIVFSFLAAFILAYLLSRFQWAKSIRPGRMFLFTWLSLITHMLLDGCTSYGTQLFLPFSDARFGLDSINVVDPIYTLPLLIGLVVSIVKRKSIPNNVGLILSSLYLLTTFGLKHTKVQELVEKDLKEQEIQFDELRTRPVGMASIHWYAIAKNSDSLYLKKYSLIKDIDTDFKAFPINDYLLDSVDVELVEEMRWFSKDLYTVMERDNGLRFFNLQVDMRGIVDDGNQVCPTAGYFELKQDDNREWQFGSGTVQPK